MTNESKNWDGEPTPLINKNATEWGNFRDGDFVEGCVARNIERRMRAAERLLEDVQFTFRSCGMPLIKAHLEAARKEDEG